MQGEYREFRCSTDGALLAKLTVDSKAEIKCRKCKTLNVHLLGTTFFLSESGDLVRYTGSRKEER